MNDMAKIVTSPTGQSVELPEGYRFEGAEVRVWRDGERVVLEPAGMGIEGEIDAETGLPLAELRRLIAEGDDESGDAEWDIDAFLKEAHARFEADRRG